MMQLVLNTSKRFHKLFSTNVVYIIKNLKLTDLYHTQLQLQFPLIHIYVHLDIRMVSEIKQTEAHGHRRCIMTLG